MNPTIAIGTRVYLKNGTAGYIRVKPPSWDYYDVHLDDGSIITAWIFDLQPETFKEFLFNRPGKVGNWSLLDMLLVQFFILGGSVWCGITFMDKGAYALVFLIAIEVMIYIGMRRNYQHKQL